MTSRLKNRKLIFLLLFLFFEFIPQQVLADKWRFLDDEKEALQCRFDLIQQAEKEILFSYYIFRNDVVGNAILHLAVEAAQTRGVKIKIIVDRHNSPIDKKIRAYLNSQGVELKKFQVKRFGRFGLFRGLHEKMMVVDGKWLITGGRNVEGKYFNLDSDYNFQDLDVLVEGTEVGREARFHFYESWHNPKVSFPLNFKKRHQKKQASVAQLLETAYKELTNNYLKEFQGKENWLDETHVTANPIRFIHDDLMVLKDSIYVKTDVKDNKCTQELIALMRTAKSQIVIENAYFIPTRNWTIFFKEAQKKGIKIKVLVNSMQSNDLVIYQAAYRNRRKKLLNLGLEIWEYQGPKKLHLKTIVIDEKISVVGSYNVHFPSETLNTEVAVVVEDSVIAKRHLKMMERNFSNAVRINENNKPEFPKNNHFPKPTCKRRVAVFFARYTVSLWLNRFL